MDLTVIESESSNLFYANERLVQPRSARKRLLKLTHTTHSRRESDKIHQ